MNIFTTRTDRGAAAVADIPSDLAELWTDPELAPHMPAALERARQASRMTDPGWAEDMPQRLRRYVEHSLVLTKHNGVWPGHIRKPAQVALQIAAPAILRDGSESQYFRDVVPQLQAPSEEAIAAWRYSEAHKDEFEAEVASVVDSMLADPERLWRARIHLDAVPIARRLLEREERASESRQMAERDRCPICGDLDVVNNGRVEVRALLPATVTSGFQRDRRAESIRSCAACHAVAVDVYLEERAAEVLPSSGKTRRELLRDSRAALNTGRG